MPPLTVLMTVYNGETFLRPTIESVLNQTYKDFKFLILDNASTDNSRDIIRSYNDPRIQLEALPGNIGQVAALKRGLAMINTRLAARIDADDICLPQRFQQQVDFLETHPEVGICGTFITTFGAKKAKWSYPCSHRDIHVKLLFECSLAHPTVMMRKDLLDQYGLNYDDTLNHSYDWDLWQRAAQCFKLANIPQYLLKYRLHEQSESQRTLDLQETTAKQLDDRSLARLGLQDHPLRHVHRDVAFETLNAANREKEFLHQVNQWFQALQAANHSHNIYDEDALNGFLKKRFFVVLTKNTRHKRVVWNYFKEQKLYRHVPCLWSAKFMVKLLLNY